MSSEAWRDQALCATAVAQGWADPDDFFDGDTNAAKRVCQDCVVQRECFEYSLTMPTYQQLFGVWGGLAARARRKYRTWSLCTRCGCRVRKSARLCEPCRPIRAKEKQQEYEARRRVGLAGSSR